jgi:excisionase family DNA binding protein
VVTKTNKQAHIGSAEMPFKLHTIAEAAIILGIGKRSVQERAAARELGHVRIGRSTRFSSADLQAFVERNAVKPLGWKGGR